MGEEWPILVKILMWLGVALILTGLIHTGCRSCRVVTGAIFEILVVLFEVLL